MKEMAHEFAEKEMRPSRPVDEKEEFPWPVMKKAFDVGLLTYALPEGYGGAGVTSHVTDCIVQEELFWGCAGIATSMGGIMLGALPILIGGNDAEKKKYLTMLTEPKKDGMPTLGAFCVDRTGSRERCRVASRRRAKKVDGGYILNGTKHFITNGGIADVYTVFATRDPSSGVDGIDGFIVEGEMKGVVPGKKEKKMGIRASHTAQVHFEDCFVPAENRLGEEGDGFSIVMQTLDHSRPIVAAGAVGWRARRLNLRLQYSQERKQFGRAIAKQQAIQFMLADMATEIDAARLLCWRAAWLLDQRRTQQRRSFDGKSFRWRYRDEGDDGCASNRRRYGVYARLSDGKIYARRQDHADLRRHGANPTHRHQRGL